MENLQQGDGQIIVPENKFDARMQRRSFLRYAGAGAAAVSMFAIACKKHDNVSSTIDVGSGDIGILNYAYALEQLEAAFYTQVAATPYSGITASETSYLTDIRDHEVAHREFFKAALGTSAIGALSVDFSKINFGDRTSVLSTAKAFEDLGVSAYNGAGYLIQSSTYLTLAGKIVSVEARHAALIRDLISYGSFADNTVLNAQALDSSRLPSAVLPMAQVYLKSSISANFLP